MKPALVGVAIAMMIFMISAARAQEIPGSALEPSMSRLESELVAKHGESAGARLTRGMSQVAKLWRSEDGDPAVFEAFVREHFAIDQPSLDQLFARFESHAESLDGHLTEITRDFRMNVDVDRGPVLPIDSIFAGYVPGAHVGDDFFANKIAFVVLLNFPLTTLEQRLAQGETWSVKQWAEARLAQGSSRRVPAEVSLEIGRVSAEADEYINDYNIWMHHVLDEKGRRLFPPKMRLISHWNLRDELKANYAEPNGIEKQKVIEKVMERIVTQTIPAAAIDNPHADWRPFSNQITAAAASDSDEPAPAAMSLGNTPEANVRYRILLDVFRASKKIDPFSPATPTVIARRFDEVREIPETRVKAMFEQVLTSPLAKEVARLIEKRLGRKLEPFDIWYNGFRPRSRYGEAELDEIVRKRYPTAEAFGKDIPNILQKLGFSKESAESVASLIEVHPSRGAGHAYGAALRGEKSYLRTRVEKEGMNYKGYNIAVHELGHNVEQTFSLNHVPSYLIQGVPNNAFTEALAFVFQERDLELLGLSRRDAESDALGVIDNFWSAFEIGGVALVDVAVWHWMYDHPDATPAELRDATVAISKDIWNRYYAPLFGVKDSVLLGIYSHMISYPLYLADYPIGHMIAFQIKQQMDRTGRIGPEFERMAKLGNISPDIWMKRATGAPVGPEALLEASRKALPIVSKINASKPRKN